MTHPAPVQATPPHRPLIDDTDFTLFVGDALDVLRTLPDESVHCVVTSPPYWGLRDYGTGSWSGGDPDCDHMAGGGGHLKDSAASTRGGANQVAEAQTVPFKGDCGKCGATRTDQQLGLEPTPEAYVARMLDVFREVRRVLRRDGTCWLNLGDSYCTTAPGTGMAGNSATSTLIRNARLDAQDAERAKNVRPATPDGLKPKDLVGIPWRVAFALQQPYYAGTIKDERDRIWLAAMIDAEGCIYIHKRGEGLDNGQGYVRKNATYGSGMEISNTSLEIIERIAAITGRGSISSVEKGSDERRRQTLYRWNLRTNECRDVLREVYPHLVSKKHQARIAIGCPSSGEKASAAHEALKGLHRGGETEVDFPAPESLLEPGWYLRSDCIWAKPNPMPESVTDRPTKAHEYLFLLTRSARYFYDADAIREGYGDPAREWWKETRTEPGNPDRKDGGGIQGRPARPGLTGGAYAPPGQSPHGNARGPDGRRETHVQAADGSIQHRNGERWPNPAGRNARSVWEIATQPYAEAHFATFPEELPRRCIAAGTSEHGCCPVCGAPWERIIEVESSWRSRAENGAIRGNLAPEGLVGAGTQRAVHGSGVSHDLDSRSRKELGWRPTCGCGEWAEEFARHSLPPIPCTVLDPFMGSGTVALVARKLGRRSIGIELNESYAELAARRLQQLSLLA